MTCGPFVFRAQSREGVSRMAVNREGAAGEFDSGATHPVDLKDFFRHQARRSMPMTKFVYSFGRGRAEGSSVMRNLLGGKGCELAEMTNLGIPVPGGFTVTTQAWAHYHRANRQWPEGLWDQVQAGPRRL